MNYTDLAIGWFLGLVSSLVASCLIWGFTTLKQKNALRKKYGPCAGKYKGYGIEGRKLCEQSSSQAEIIYLHDNILEICLSHDGSSRTWRGSITMETADIGTIVWQYIDPAEHGEFGFKRCIWNGVENRLYLVGEKLDGYGREVLIKEV